MSDSIERGEVIGALYKCTPFDPKCIALLGKCMEVIKAIPSADRPQGKWKAKSFHEYFCEKCGFAFDMMKCEFLENMKYCPNSGVRKGADDEEVDVL